jgi:heme exporter protein C
VDQSHPIEGMDTSSPRDPDAAGGVHHEPGDVRPPRARGAHPARSRLNGRGWLLQVFGGVVFLLLLLALLGALVWAPREATMGNVQRLFYFHVAAAWIALGLGFTVVFALSIAYLATGRLGLDRVAAASAEIGVVFTTITLVTGPLWAKPVWGVYWTWEPRLTTTLVLWFIYVGYLLLRSLAGDGQRRARLAAVYGIVGWVDVPIVFFAIWWWRTVHPRLLTSQGMALDPRMGAVLALSLVAFTLLYLYLLLLRADIEGLSARVRALRFRSRFERGGRQ